MAYVRVLAVWMAGSSKPHARADNLRLANKAVVILTIMRIVQTTTGHTANARTNAHSEFSPGLCTQVLAVHRPIAPRILRRIQSAISTLEGVINTGICRAPVGIANADGHTG